MSQPTKLNFEIQAVSLSSPSPLLRLWGRRRNLRTCMFDWLSSAVLLLSFTSAFAYGLERRQQLLTLRSSLSFSSVRPLRARSRKVIEERALPVRQRTSWIIGGLRSRLPPATWIGLLRCGVLGRNLWEHPQALGASNVHPRRWSLVLISLSPPSSWHPSRRSPGWCCRRLWCHRRRRRR